MPIETVDTEEAMAMYTNWPPGDAHLITAELGVALRPLKETLTDTMRTLVEAGRIPGKQAGCLGVA